MQKNAAPKPKKPLVRPTTDAEARALAEAWKACGYSIQELSDEHGVPYSSVRRWTRDALRLLGIDKASLAPALIPEGMRPGKTTVQYDAQGNVINEWRRLHPEMDDLEKVVQRLEKRVAGKAPVIPKPTGKIESDLLLEIPIPDHHLGALAWAAETGADYDTEISAKLLVDSVAMTLADTPKVGKVLLVNMGDFFHADGRTAVTEKSGHVLDVDSRFEKRIDAGIQAFCACIELALKHAETVELVSIPGNHDLHSVKWTSRVLAAYYRNNPRVIVRTNPRNRQYVQHGRVLLGFMHGDCMKAAHFARVIPAEQPKMWNDTEFRYGRVGHWHHRVGDEFPGIVIETLPTLAAPDSYAADHGFMSRRALTTFLWSAKWGLRRKMELSVGEILG